MKNTSLYCGVICNEPTEYFIQIDVESATYENYKQILKEIEEQLLRVFSDNLSPQPEREKVVLSDSKSYLISVEEAKKQIQDKRDTRQAEIIASSVEAPKELIDVVSIVCQSGIADQYRRGNVKAINSLVGNVMKQYKYDAAIIKTLLLKELNG